MVSPSAPAAPMATGELRVCPECGAVAPAGRARCGVCETALGPLCPTVPLPLPGRAWARVEVTLACPHCTTAVPLRPDAVGAPVPCPHCGHTTQVDLGWWDEALHLAHASVDLSFPDLHGLNAPLGQHNPFAAVGASESCLALPNEALPSQSPLRLRVGPGAPLCPRCRGPVSVRTQAPGRVTASCGRCGDREAFAVPEVITQRFSAVRAMVAYAPEGAAAAGRVEPWWILLDGISYLRPVVQENKAQAERADAERVAWEQWQRQERERQEQEARVRAEREAHDRAAREKADKEARERRERERVETAAREAGEAAARERAERERLEGELARAVESHRAELERVQREAWEHVQRERAQHEQAMAAGRAELERQGREHAERDRKTRRRQAVAYVLWGIFFVAVASDLALAFVK